MKSIIAAALIVSATASAHAPPRVEKHGSTQQMPAPPAKITPVYSQALPNVPGKSLKGVLVEYAPGGSSPPHRHARSALIYATVLEGTVLCQLNGRPVRTYRPGDNWTEMPGDHHQISANASKTEPAKVLAVFVVDDADVHLTIPDR